MRLMRRGIRRHTILFIERDVLVRNLVRTFLQESYLVLFAADGDEALEVSRKYTGSIDILLSAVKKVRKGGLPVHKLVATERPGIGILLVKSGSGALARENGHPFLNKPFQMGPLYASLEKILAMAADDKSADLRGPRGSAHDVDSPVDSCASRVARGLQMPQNMN
jgi:DNA-binding NtrC family response regulator